MVKNSFYEEIKLSQIEHDYLSKKEKILIIVLTLILCLLKESTIIVF